MRTNIAIDEELMAAALMGFWVWLKDCSSSLKPIASLYDTQGQYAKAEPLYQRALAIREKVLGPEHPDVAICLNNLAPL